MTDHDKITIGFLGFGEAGQSMAASIARDQPAFRLFAYDKLRGTAEQCQNAPLDDIVSHCPTPEMLAQSAQLIISVVTADQSYDAAMDCALFLTQDHIFLDGNSVSPGTKKTTASKIRHDGAGYIDLAIMAPINPRGHQTPLLLAGDCKDRICPILDQLACAYTWESDAVGDASVVKMIRSILIKGMESLICEAMTAAVPLGHDERILNSVGKTLGINDMTALAHYVTERVVSHGTRRAAEMREVANTLEELGLSNDMASAIASHQDKVAAMNIKDEFEDGVPQDYPTLTALMQKNQQS